MKRTKRTGRPPLPKKDRRSKIVMLRLTGDECAALKAAAKLRGQTVTDFIRRAALAVKLVQLPKSRRKP